MKWLTLNDIKDQLRIERDFTDDDKLLTRYGESAENTILNICRRTYDDFISEYGEIPSDIVEASLLLVTVSYEHRAAVSQYQMYSVGYAFDMKVKPYMRLASDGEDAQMQVFTIGSDVKIIVAADLPNDLTMADVDFTVKVYNVSAIDKEKVYPKESCIDTGDGDYVVLVDSDDLGIGVYMVRLTVQIPDTDYPSGYRKEVVKINPHVMVKG
jgi:hypothetical protein